LIVGPETAKRMKTGLSDRLLLQCRRYYYYYYYYNTQTLIHNQLEKLFNTNVSILGLKL